jgi:thiamine-phosphate pyrophosphorylase
VSLVQLREKTAAPAEFYQQAHEALLAAHRGGMKVIINDRVDIALALRADGVHLGQDDLPPGAARRLLGPDLIIGFSTHDLRQAEAATQMPIDYIAIGPMFSTQSKRAANLPVGLEGLRLVRRAVGTIPLVAIGGITLENSRSVLEAGADAVSVIGSLWRPFGGAETRVREFLTIAEDLS